MIETSSGQIAGDLMVAIHQRLIRPGEQLPSHVHLMGAYQVAMATVSSAIAKLTAANLVTTQPGKGVFVKRWEVSRHPVMDLMTASGICRDVASTYWQPDSHAVVYLGPASGPHDDPEKMAPPLQVDVAALVGLDRHLLRWMSEAFLAAARRVVASGTTGDTDEHLIRAARSIVSGGGARPEGQPPIAQLGGPVPMEEAVGLRIWPERANPPADGAPF